MASVQGVLKRCYIFSSSSIKGGDLLEMVPADYVFVYNFPAFQWICMDVGKVTSLIELCLKTNIEK